jgi:tetratricopeptide (TPR) repeat protein
MDLRVRWRWVIMALVCSAGLIQILSAAVWPEETDVSPASMAGAYELRLKAIDAYRANAYRESTTLFKQALGELRDPEGAGAVVLWNELSAAALADGDATSAEQDCRTSVRLNEKRSDPDLRELAISYRSLGVIYERRGQFKQAEEFYGKAEKTADKGGLLGGPVGGAILRGEAVCLLKQERYQEAKPLLDKALAIFRQNNAQTPDYGKALSNYSLLQLQTGHYKEAEVSAREALPLLTGLIGEEPNIMATLNNLGVTLTQSGNPAAGEVEFRRAVELGRKNPRLLAVPLAEALNNMAAAEKLTGEFALARDHALEALKLTEGPFDDTTTLEATILNNLGLISLADKDLPNAERYCTKAAGVWAKSGGRDNSKYAAALSNLAAIERARKQYRKAYDLESKALTINETVLGEDHPATAANLANLGVDLFCLKRFDQALATLERAERLQEKRFGRDSVATAYTLRNIAAMLAELKRYSDASETYDRAIRAREVAVPDPFDVTLAQWIREDAATLRKAGRFGEAEMAEVRAMKIDVKNAIRPTKQERSAVGLSATTPQSGESLQGNSSGASQ